MNAICCNIMYDNIEIFKKIYDAYARYEKTLTSNTEHIIKVDVFANI